MPQLIRARWWVCVGLSLLLATGCGAADLRDILGNYKKVGSGTLTWFGFDVYLAELWSANGTYRRDQPFVLSLRYARAAKAQKLVDVSLDQMEKQGVPEARRMAWQTILQHSLVDVVKGDTLAGWYRPAAGITFFHNGQRVAEVDNLAFAHDFVDIWFGANTTEPLLKQQLQGASR